MNANEIGRRVRASPAANLVVRRLLRAGLRTTRWTEDLATRWQVSGTVTVMLQGASFRMLGRADDPVLDALYYGRAWETGETALFAILAQEADVVLDIGANTGVYSLMSTHLSDTVTVIAAEPSPANARRLRTNLALNRSARVTVVEVAVGPYDGTLELTVPADGSISVSASAFGAFSRAYHRGAHATVPVVQRSIDAIVGEHALDRVDLIKLDVECSELAALQGATSTLADLDPVVLAEVLNFDVLVELMPELRERVQTTNAELVEALMSACGYTFFAIGRRGILRVADLRASGDGGSNYLFVKRPPLRRFIPYTDVDAIRALLRADR